MSIGKFLLPLSALLLLAGCGEGTCDSGNVTTYVQKTEMDLPFDGSGKGDIPSGFDFTANEFAQAITGVWFDTAVTLTLAPFDPAVVQYNYSEDNTACDTETKLAMKGTLDDTAGTSSTLEGTFLSRGSLNGANLTISDSTGSCWFEYASATIDVAATLHGTCNFQGVQAGTGTSGELYLIKN